MVIDIQKIYQVDAFTDKVFGGNPAAVCPLASWLDDSVLQNIAMENNLAETAFYVEKDGRYEIRWFTPILEVDLCGHATLASAYVLFFIAGVRGNVVNFHSPRSGELTVTRNEEILTLNFPSDIFNEVPLTEELTSCFSLKPKQAFKGKTDYMLVYDSEDEISKLVAAFDAIVKVDCRGIIVTAPGKEVDFVSRFFAPQSGVNEDPVTGSAHTTLTPYWSERLSKKTMSAIQLSQRKGILQCTYLNERVEISGKGKLYLTGEIWLR